MVEARPVFLTKKQREALKQAQAEEEQSKRREHQSQVNQSRKQFIAGAATQARTTQLGR